MVNLHLMMPLSESENNELPLLYVHLSSSKVHGIRQSDERREREAKIIRLEKTRNHCNRKWGKKIFPTICNQMERNIKALN